jgi:hypothetical protein
MLRGIATCKRSLKVVLVAVVVVLLLFKRRFIHFAVKIGILAC